MPARSHGERTRLRGSRHGEVGHLADVELMSERVRGAEHVRRLLRQIARPLLRRHDARRTAVGDHAAIEQVERIGDESRRQHVVDRDRVAVLRQRVEARVLAHRHRDLGQLLRRRTELVHVPGGGERVVADERVAPDRVRRAAVPIGAPVRPPVPRRRPICESCTLP